MTVQTYQLEHVFSNTKRVERLREKVLTTKPFVCVERARLITEAYRKSEGKNAPIRKALALKHLLESMTIYINDGELIVGNNSSGPPWIRGGA
jgi:formate C-acetyltransferase